MRLIEMSISAGVLIVFAALFRTGRLFHLSKRTVMMLWMVVLARMLLPMDLPLQSGIASPAVFLMQRLSHRLGLKTAAVSAGMTDGIKQAASAGISNAAEGRAGQAAWLIWMAGMAAAGLYFVYCYLKEYRMLAQAVPLKSSTASRECILEACESAQRLTKVTYQNRTMQIWVHDRIRSPLVFGIVKQKIVLPKNLTDMNPASMQHILTHEMIHMKRRDNLWKLLSAAALCIHWFNPLAWLMYLLVSRDLELSCDERVLSLYGASGRKEYAAVLLALVQNQNQTVLCGSGFLEKPVKERIVAIMNYKKLTGTGVLCAVIMLLGASSVFATNETVLKPENQTAQSEENKREDAQETEVRYTLTEVESNDESSDAQTKSIRMKVSDADEIRLEVNGSELKYDAENVDGTYFVDDDGSVYQLETEVRETVNDSDGVSGTDTAAKRSEAVMDSDAAREYSQKEAEGKENDLVYDAGTHRLTEDEEQNVQKETEEK